VNDYMDDKDLIKEHPKDIERRIKMAQQLRFEWGRKARLGLLDLIVFLFVLYWTWGWVIYAVNKWDSFCSAWMWEAAEDLAGFFSLLMLGRGNRCGLIPTYDNNIDMPCMEGSGWIDWWHRISTRAVHYMPNGHPEPIIWGYGRGLLWFLPNVQFTYTSKCFEETYTTVSILTSAFCTIFLFSSLFFMIYSTRQKTRAMLLRLWTPKVPEWHLYEFDSFVKSPKKRDLRPDQYRVQRVRHADCRLVRIKHTSSLGLSYTWDKILWFIYGLDTGKKTTYFVASLELYEQLVHCSAFSLRSSEEQVCSALETRASQIYSVNIDRSLAIGGTSVVKDTALLAYGAWQHYRLARESVPFIVNAAT
jgi:hypothetical protein